MRLTMTKPTYCIRLSGMDITKELISCTGAQLCTLLNILCEHEKKITWYAADVTMIPNKKDWELYKQYRPLMIGDTTRFIELCQQVAQFTSGVFLATFEINNLKSWAKDYETEGEEFADNEFADIEIRAFDTSYFEIYSKSENILNPFIGRYDCNLNQKEKKK